MAFKAARYKAEDVMNTWEIAEMGLNTLKKKHKRDIRRQQRTIEKRLARRTVNEYIND